MDKTYNFNGKEITISGTDDLHNFINDVITEHTQYKESLDKQPNLEQQLQLWEKAKPYYKEYGLEVDYSKNPTEVMRNAIGDKFPIDENTSEDTLRYLFQNVLPAINDAQSQTSNGKTTTGNNSKGKTEKPPVVESKNTGGMTSQELSIAMGKKRLEGVVIKNG